MVRLSLERNAPRATTSSLGVFGRSIWVGETPSSVKAGESGVRILSNSGTASASWRTSLGVVTTVSASSARAPDPTTVAAISVSASTPAAGHDRFI